MGIIPVFRDITQPPEPWTAEICDIVRDQWQAGIPKPLRVRPADLVPSDNLTRGTTTLLERAAARRAELAAIIMPLHRAGQIIPKLAEAAQCSPTTVARILAEHGVKPNRSTVGGFKNRDYTQFVPQAMAMRAQGKSWRDIGTALGICRAAISKACQAHEARK
ncbi:hypothetical protein [Paracoccus sp. SY]|uniref:hypothetical protein n=1 Tax=Paracoccus sp. SY TaxID=1330255 RepID=UPI000CCFD6CC|nr:hypothetical protein [Paracoccus sp. SY]